MCIRNSRRGKKSTSGVGIIPTVFSPAYLRHVGLTSLQHIFSFMWERKEAKRLD
jgi:hypothetical protein